ncbi:MAG: hypothetical protein QOG20_4107 [Pseudonocardiales bacterium]|jgi:hypothetical protein|nr:hypothetical protein [Pseudonocardiales bacterium]
MLGQTLMRGVFGSGKASGPTLPPDDLPDDDGILICPEHSIGTVAAMRSVALAGLLASVAVVAAGCGTTAAAPSPSTTPPTAAKKHAAGIRGRVTAENGSTWTVTTLKGKAITVTLTPQTAFGTKIAPATQAQFPVGSQVRVAGRPSGSAITAVRIAAPVAPKPTPANTTSAPAAPGA